MTLNNINSMRKDRGFTIVELLIVIVVIAILAAISIVAYTGVTTKANTSTAKANAESIQRVAEAYYADETKTGYPDITAINAYNGYARVPSGVSLVSTTLSSTHKDGKTIQYVMKGTTGVCIGYWDSSITTAGQAGYIYAGDAKTGTNGATPSCA